MKSIDINCDMGESFGRWELGNDQAVLPYVSSVNIAAGFHAGDPTTIRRTVEMAVEQGVQLGVHVGLPDLLGFGRRRMALSRSDIMDYCTYQIGAVQAFAESAGSSIRHVKPHGALYVMASTDGDVADAVIAAIAAVELPLSLYLLDRRFEDLATANHVNLFAEGFPDLHYDEVGNLIVENPKQAWDPEHVAQRALAMVQNGVVHKIDGTPMNISVDTLCVHGDASNAAEVAQQMNTVLRSANVSIEPLS